MICVPAPQATLELASFRQYRWDTRTVRVLWLNGDPNVQARVQAVVECGWNRASALQFVWVDSEPAEIRVMFEPGASWSYVGMMALSVSGPTMQLALHRDSSDTDVRRTALHEFGHASGYLHEQASPHVAIPWDLPAVYAYYRQRGWDAEMVDRQVLRREGEDVADAGTYDTESVLHYYIPAELVLDRVARGGATQLSEQDKAMARTWYGPPPDQPQTHLPIVRGM